MPVLIGRVQVKNEHAAPLHKVGSLADGLLKIFLRANVAVGVKRRHRGADRAIQVQVQQVLLQQQQAARQAQLVGLFAQDTEHLLGAVNADDIIPCLGQHQGQIAGAAAQVGQDAVCDAVGLSSSVI